MSNLILSIDVSYDFSATTKIIISEVGVFPDDVTLQDLTLPDSWLFLDLSQSFYTASSLINSTTLILIQMKLVVYVDLSHPRTTESL